MLSMEPLPLVNFIKRVDDYIFKMIVLIVITLVKTGMKYQNLLETLRLIERQFVLNYCQPRYKLYYIKPRYDIFSTDNLLCTQLI